MSCNGLVKVDNHHLRRNDESKIALVKVIALSLVVQNADEECNINNNAGKNNAISLLMQYFFGEYNVCFW